MASTRTLTFGGATAIPAESELYDHYLKLVSQPKLGWTEHLRLKRLLGTGGQGIVYLSERRGSDNFTLPVALKFFSPERFPDERAYREAMEKMAAISSRVAQIQHDNLIDVHMGNLRRKIDPASPPWIQTVRGRGFRLSADAAE